MDEQLTQALESKPEKAKSIEVLIEALCGSDRPVDVMADRLGSSSRTINRLWRQLVGISPRAYAKLMRVHRALALIEQGGAPASVADDCGFSDQAHMARQIKEIAGLPPLRMQSWLGEQVYQDLYTQRPQAPWQHASRD